MPLIAVKVDEFAPVTRLSLTDVGLGLNFGCGLMFLKLVVVLNVELLKFIMERL